jgi:FixJ family two-component response regulator
VYVAIVDDHAGLREAIAALLEVAGYPSRGFRCAEDFIACPEIGEAACVVLDEYLPGIDGLALQRRLAESDARLPLVFISAHENADRAVPARALRGGAIAFFRKPFQDDEFLGAVQRAWRAGAQRHRGGM